ncbi:MAG TPA: ATP-binding protein, partial [Candidatus Elarobacter sp.]|nr:ATP-binding protein [Candidatus Elarobacter sp.]
ATLTLGKIHWKLLRAANFMDALRFKKVKKYGNISTTEWTEFGNEVGADEINWWIFKKETQLTDLRKQTELALESAQILKTSSGKLENAHPETYDELLAMLRKFAEKHSGEIESICAYLSWLEGRDRMAPIILFTYRVWGSTRMSDRWIDVPIDAPPVPDANDMRICTEVVLGLRDRHFMTYDYVEGELSYEMWESMDPEQIADDSTISIPPSRILNRASRKIFKECSIYFAEIRDSLRNVLIDLDKFDEQKNLLHSDAFWREFIVKAVQSKKVETQIWDFKETLPIWHVKQQSERDRAKVNFAEDVASFANAEGGVLIVGVSDKREIVGLGDSPRELENRLKSAMEILTKHVEYQRDIMFFQQLEIPVKNEKKVCLVIVIAQARDTVGVNNGHGTYTYPVRQETGVERLSNLDLSTRKMHIKADNYDFIRQLKQFIVDN